MKHNYLMFYEDVDGWNFTLFDNASMTDEEALRTARKYLVEWANKQQKILGSLDQSATLYKIVDTKMIDLSEYRDNDNS